MSKRLVVCCDGTWNTPDQRSGADLTSTNVTKIALAIEPEDPSGREQRAYYDAGVGTKRWERIRGGVFGYGVSRNVKDAYRFLVQNFDPGDELYFVGFSRGAFTGAAPQDSSETLASFGDSTPTVSTRPTTFTAVEKVTRGVSRRGSSGAHTPMRPASGSSVYGTQWALLAFRSIGESSICSTADGNFTTPT